MRANLNLLPEEKKAEIEKKKNLRMILYQSILLFSALVFLGVILVNINLILRIQLKAFDELASLEQGNKQMIEVKEFENKFKEINSRAATLYQMKSSNLVWSKLFEKLSMHVPNEVKILNLATQDYVVLISGNAANREQLIKFKDNLSNEDCFTDVNVPLSNLVVKDNIDFQIDLKIKKECLKNE